MHARSGDNFTASLPFKRDSHRACYNPLFRDPPAVGCRIWTRGVDTRQVPANHGPSCPPGSALSRFSVSRDKVCACVCTLHSLVRVEVCLHVCMSACLRVSLYVARHDQACIMPRGHHLVCADLHADTPPASGGITVCMNAAAGRPPHLHRAHGQQRHAQACRAHRLVQLHPRAAWAQPPHRGGASGGKELQPIQYQ